jgi:hypothetical protein
MSQSSTVIRFNRQPYKAYYKLSDLLDENTIDDDSFVTSFQHSEDGKRYFILFDNYQKFSTLVYQLLPPSFLSNVSASKTIQSFDDYFQKYPEQLEQYKNKHLSLNFNEVISNDHPFRMFFDIDCDDVSVDKDVLLSEVVDAILKYLEERESIIYPKNRIMVISGHKETKISYHLIFTDLVVEDMKTMKYISNEISSYLSEEYKDYVDQSYGENKNFRMLFQTKRGSKTFLKFQKKWTYNYHDIEYIPEIQTEHQGLYFSVIFEESLVRCFNNYKYFIKSNKDESQNYEYKELTTLNLTQEQLDEILEKAMSFIPTGLKMGEINENGFIQLINQDGFNCPCCSDHKGIIVRHDNDNAFLWINEYGVYFKCYRAGLDVKSVKLISQYIPDGVENTTDNDTMELIQEKPEYGYLTEPYFTNVYDEKYCLPINMVKNSIYLLSAGLGKGKTKVIVDFIKEQLSQNQETRILILSPRQIFASSLLNRINQDNLNFTCYLDKRPKEYINQIRFIVQMESLQHIQNDYDIIIVDEIESCLAQFESAETMKFNLKQCAETFERLIKKSTYIIGCDAFLSTKTVNVLSKICKKKMFIYKNESPLVKRKAEEYDSIASLTESLVNDLKIQKKIFFVSASKDKIDYIEKLVIKHLPEIRYKVYHSNSKEKITNVNENWGNVDLIMVSPSVTVGINYDLEDFDLLYLYGSPNSCCVRDIFQSSMRVRHINENKMKFCCISNNFQSTNKDESVYSLHNIRQKLLMDKSLHKEFYNQNISEDKDNLLNWVDMCNWLFLNKLYTIKERNQSRSFYKKVFYYYLGLCNYYYDMSEQIKLEVKHILYDYEKVIDYHQIPKINSSEEAKEIMEKFKEEKNNDLIISLLKYNFDKTVKTDLINPEKINNLFKEYINPATRKIFYNIKKEKFRYGHIDRTDYLRNVFWENSDKSAMRTFKIKELNAILGIQNSCESIVLNLEQTTQVIEKVLPMYNDLCSIFNIKEQKLEESTPDEQSRKKVKYILQQVYQKWNGCKIKNIRKQLMVKGKRSYQYIFTKNICGFENIEGSQILLSSILK